MFEQYSLSGNKSKSDQTKMIRSKKTSEDLIFTKLAADEILNVPIGTVKAIHVNREKGRIDCIFVQQANSSKIKRIEKSDFYHQFSQSRKDKAKKLNVEQINHQKYKVNAPYYVGAKPGSVRIERYGKILCDCGDFSDQLEAFLGQIACCQHVYAVLGVLGHNSLSSYLHN
jgi:hypothetical protein